MLSFTDVIVKSSNVGAIKIGLRLGPERLGVYVEALRLRPSHVAGLPGESPGILWDPVEAERQRACVDGDGLSGRRHAAADGGGRQRRSPTAASSMQPRVVRAVIGTARAARCRAKVLGRAIDGDDGRRR